MNDLDTILNALAEFTEKRDWDQFHNPKDLAIAISIEANELLELFLWKSPEDADKEKVKGELADILSFTFLLARKYGLDIRQVMLEKIQQNELKYPVEKAKGSSKKYTEL